MITDIYYVIPEIFLSLSLMFLLLLGVFKKNGSSIVYNLSIEPPEQLHSPCTVPGKLQDLGTQILED